MDAMLEHIWLGGAVTVIVSLGACTRLLGDDFEIVGVGGATSTSAASVGGSGASGGGSGGSLPGLDHVWSRVYGSTDSQNVMGVAVDANAQIGIVGTFRGALDLGQDMLSGNNAGFIGKLDPEGEPLWGRVIPHDTANPLGNYVAVAAFDGEGSLYAAGSFAGQTDFGAGPVTSVGGYDGDVFLLKLDTNGGYGWHRTWGDTAADRASSVAVGPGDVVAIAGTFQGVVNLGGGNLDTDVAGTMFVGLFDKDGGHLASRGFGTGYVIVSDVAVDQSGFVYVVGSYDTPIDFGDGMHSVVGGSDLFLVKLHPSLNAVWSVAVGSNGIDQAYAVTVNDAGVAIVGEIGGPVDFGGGAVAHAGGADAYAALFDVDGDHVFSASVGAAGDQRFFAADWLTTGQLVLAGELIGTVELGDTLTSDGQYSDVVFGALDASWVPFVGRRYGEQFEQPPILAALPDGGILLGLNSGGTIDFGGGPLTSAGDYDAFLAKLR